MLKKMLHPLISRMVTGAISLILKSCKITVDGAENLQTNGNPRILMLWHNQMALVLNTLEKYSLKNIIYNLIISNSRDADILASIVERYPKNARVLRVAHNNRHKAALEMVESLKRGEVMMITPDGPRGSRYTAKRGIAFTSKAAKAEVVGFAWSCSKFWQLSTWDRFIIPKPFSTIHVLIGEVIGPDTHESLDQKETAKLFEEKLNGLYREACSKITEDEARWPV